MYKFADRLHPVAWAAMPPSAVVAAIRFATRAIVLWSVAVFPHDAFDARVRSTGIVFEAAFAIINGKALPARGELDPRILGEVPAHSSLA